MKNTKVLFTKTLLLSFLTRTETMAIAGAFSRSVLRSTSFRNAAARVTSEAKAKTSPSPSFRLSSNQKPLSHRIFKSPVELSCFVDSLMPFHSATSSAILISKLGVSLHAYDWLLQVVTWALCLFMTVSTSYYCRFLARDLTPKAAAVLSILTSILYPMDKGSS